MTNYELTHFKKMVQVWKTKSLLFCSRRDPLIVFWRKKSYNFHFHKNDVTWPLIANGLFETDPLTHASFQPFIWWRYMDDIFMIWTRSVQDLNTFTSFLNLLNDIHPTMKFTCDYSFTPIPFLDVSVSLHNGKIVTVLDTKPTDKHQYLLNKENIK